MNLALGKKMESDFHPLLQQAFLVPSLVPALSHLLLLQTVNKWGLCSNPDKLRGPHGRPDKPHRTFSSVISNRAGDGRSPCPRPVNFISKGQSLP